ncbi:MAG: hypothetical protein EB036_09345 [Betaproteobacteria bacterium]|nr:hypothetical protein [Betaproteobacteria bacterium]
MTSKHLSYLLIGLLLLIQYPLWIGKGGWLRVWELDRQVQIQRADNQRLMHRPSTSSLPSICSIAATFSREQLHLK